MEEINSEKIVESLVDQGGEEKKVEDHAEKQDVESEQKNDEELIEKEENVEQNVKEEEKISRTRMVTIELSLI